MVGLNLGGSCWSWACRSLVLHLASVALTKALRTYSRSRLEEYCAGRGRPERADEVVHLDERTERCGRGARRALGLLLAALLGVAAGPVAPAGRPRSCLIADRPGGRRPGATCWRGSSAGCFAEPILDAFWPATRRDPDGRLAADRGFVGLRVPDSSDLAGNPTNGARPASVEVEIPTDDGDGSDEDLEAELPEATADLLQRAVELARTRRLGDHDARTRRSSRSRRP